MDATTMPSIPSPLLQRLKRDYPALTFVEGTDFAWSPVTKTIVYNPKALEGPAFLLHELAHASLNHTLYKRDIELLVMERAAWDLAMSSLGPRYDYDIDDELVEQTLDTYRDWLHARSTCPSCGSTGLQTKQREYKCLACGQIWQVNEARTCELRRYTKKTR